MNLNLKDKVVIVTGGAAGIGRATVEAFTSEGAKVVVWHVPEVDVTKPDVVNAATATAAARYARRDVIGLLVVGAYHHSGGGLSQASPARPQARLARQPADRESFAFGPCMPAFPELPWAHIHRQATGR